MQAAAYPTQTGRRLPYTIRPQPTLHMQAAACHTQAGRSLPYTSRPQPTLHRQAGLSRRSAADANIAKPAVSNIRTRL